MTWHHLISYFTVEKMIQASFVNWHKFLNYEKRQSFLKSLWRSLFDDVFLFSIQFSVFTNSLRCMTFWLGLYTNYVDRILWFFFASNHYWNMEYNKVHLCLSFWQLMTRWHRCKNNPRLLNTTNYHP